MRLLRRFSPLLTTLVLMSSCRLSSAPTEPPPPTLLSSEKLSGISTGTATDLLVAARTPVTETELFRRIDMKDAQAIQILLRAGISPDATSGGIGALTAAVRADAPDAISALLLGGSDVNAGGNTAPIFMAALLGRDECARRLAEFKGAAAEGIAKRANGHLRGGTPGIDRDAVNSEGRTALFIAVSEEHVNVVQVLLENGWNPAKEDKAGESVLDRAFKRENGVIVRRLIEYGAPLNTRDSEGLTPLARAAASGATATTVEMMLDRGAATDVRDGQGRTALDLAILNNHDELVALLQKRGARPGATR